MENQEYPKGKLSRDYFELHKERSSIHGRPCPKIYSIIKKRIAGEEEQIKEIYKKYGNLGELEIKGFGPETKKDLELILGKGVDKVLEDIRMRAEEVKKVKREDYFPIHSKIDRLCLTRRT